MAMFGNVASEATIEPPINTPNLPFGGAMTLIL
jgi:hypothetical protein